MSRASRGILLIALGLLLTTPVGLAVTPPAPAGFTANELVRLKAFSTTGLVLLFTLGIYNLATCSYAHFLATRVREVAGRGA